MKLKHLVVPPSEGRHHPRHIFWSGKRGALVFQIFTPFLMLQLLFLSNLCYMFGSMYRESERGHRLNVLMVNFDDSVIATSLRGAVRASAAPTFPNVVEAPVSEYQNISDIIHVVRTGQYWGAIYTHAGASDRLAAALLGGEAADAYNASDAITYVWNEARYSATSESVIEANMEKLIAQTAAVYHATNGTAALGSTNSTDPAALAALCNPIRASNYNIKPTTQGVRVVYQALPIVFAILIQFFFLMAVNGIFGHLQLYSHLSIPFNALVRLILSWIYTFIGSLCFSAAIWAFQENWGLTTAEFFLMWMTFWLHMHINFCVLDVATAFIAVPFLPFFVIAWVIPNITSTLTPFELAPGFYRWSYALPAHETYTILIQIWTGGADNFLYRALPILCVWEFVGLVSAYLALNYRCVKTRKALLEEEHIKKKVKEGHMSDLTGLTFTLEALMGREAEDRDVLRDQYFPEAHISIGGLKRHGPIAQAY
ncbi:hypothetical protein ANO11243_071620 [Dothideomycetidae sp. 11243]|nr:hypothetical protein ANO11243_071620 [fungal sp. No.11243]